MMNKVIIASVLLVAFVGAVRADLSEAQVQICWDKLVKAANSIEIPSEILEVAEAAEGDISEHFKDEEEKMNFVHLVTKFFHGIVPKVPGKACFGDEGFRAKLDAIEEESEDPGQEQIIVLLFAMGFSSQVMDQGVDPVGAELDEAQVNECVEDYVKNTKDIEIPKEIVRVAEHVKEMAGSTEISEYLSSAKAGISKFVAEQADLENLQFLATEISTTLGLSVPTYCVDNDRFLDIVQEELGQTDSFKPVDYIKLSMIISKVE